MEVSTAAEGPNKFFQNYTVYVIEIFSEIPCIGNVCVCVCKNKVDIVAFPSVSMRTLRGG